jgi:hypothetical protein
LSKSVFKVAVTTVVITLVKSSFILILGSSLFLCYVFPRSVILLLTDIALAFRLGITSIRAIPTIITIGLVIPSVLVIAVMITTVLVVIVIFMVYKICLISGGRVYFLLSYNRWL